MFCGLLYLYTHLSICLSFYLVDPLWPGLRGEGRARQSRAGHRKIRAVQGRAGQVRAWEIKGKARHGIAGHGRAGHWKVKEGQGMGRQWQGWAREGKSREGHVRVDLAKIDQEYHIHLQRTYPGFPLCCCSVNRNTAQQCSV